MKLLIAGSDKTDRRCLAQVLDRCRATWGAFEMATAGGGRVEEAGSRWAERQRATWVPGNLIPTLGPAEWADVLVAFDAAHSPRTRALCRAMREQGKPVHEYGPKGGKIMTRSEHLAWAKERAIEYLDAGDPGKAIASMLCDLNTHEELCAHPGVELGVMQVFARHLKTTEAVRDWIEAFQ